MPYLFIIAVPILLIILFVIVKYNSMIQTQNRVKEGWADIDVQLKRRYNLIPNLVETVKGYASHEQETFTKVTEARNMAINAGDIKTQGQAENMLSGALKSLFAVAESYPDLKANQNFLQLQNELVDTEDKIQAARRFYNGMVRDFNTLIQKFPANIIAGMFNFKDQEFFEIEDEAQKENVQVSFKEGEAAPAAPQPVAATEPGTETPSPTPAAVPEAPAPVSPTPVAETATATAAEPTPTAAEATSSTPEKCPKCGGDMTPGHVCPVAAPETPAEPSTPVTTESPIPEAPTPAEPVTPTPQPATEMPTTELKTEPAAAETPATPDASPTDTPTPVEAEKPAEGGEGAPEAPKAGA